MARKKGGGHGGHGWFVTFADLMALLMSFFVMIAAYSTQDKVKMQAVAGAMRDAFGSQKDVRLSGIVEIDGIPTKPNLKHSKVRPIEEASDITAPNSHKRKDWRRRPLIAALRSPPHHCARRCRTCRKLLKSPKTC
jgi:chemotaxis protein MotB